MTTRKKSARKIEFTITVSGTVEAATLEVAEEKLDFATNTYDLQRRGIVIERRITSVATP